MYCPEVFIISKRKEIAIKHKKLVGALNCEVSIFSKLDEHDLADWLESYCLSELWEKNVLGGLP